MRDQERQQNSHFFKKDGIAPPVINKLCVINLLEQDINNLFVYQSEVVSIGSSTFELDDSDDHQCAKVLSVMLR